MNPENCQRCYNINMADGNIVRWASLCVVSRNYDLPTYEHGCKDRESRIRGNRGLYRCTLCDEQFRVYKKLKRHKQDSHAY